MEKRHGSTKTTLVFVFMVIVLLLSACGRTVSGCKIKERASCPGAALSGINLSETNLNESDLSGADLSYAYLFKAQLE